MALATASQEVCKKLYSGCAGGRLCRHSHPTRPAAVKPSQRGGFTGCRLCRRPLQNSMFGCYDDLSDAKQYSCNLLFYWLMLPLFTGMIILYTLEDSNLHVILGGRMLSQSVPKLTKSISKSFEVTLRSKPQ